MPVKEKPISQDALAVLSECSVSGHELMLPGAQLERKLYLEVNEVLQGIGGKWNKKAKAHVFEESQEEIEEMLEGCIQTGLAVPLHRNGYFPTPPAIADYIVELAQLVDGHLVLEPSAGTGNIVHAILRTSFRVVVITIENDPKLIPKLGTLDSKWVHVFEQDFLCYSPASNFDRVIMNPPFATKGASLADIDHVMHGWELLKPGGRLVSIMSASMTFRRENKAVEFRKHVEKFGRFEELPEKSFKESGTLVKTIVVVLDKPNS